MAVQEDTPGAEVGREGTRRVASYCVVVLEGWLGWRFGGERGNGRGRGGREKRSTYVCDVPR